MTVHKWEQTSFRAKEFVWEVAIEANSHPKQARLNIGIGAETLSMKMISTLSLSNQCAMMIRQ